MSVDIPEENRLLSDAHILLIQQEGRFQTDIKLPTNDPLLMQQIAQQLYLILTQIKQQGGTS